MTITVDWAAVAAFQAQPGIAALGVIERRAAVLAEFPEVEAWANAREARKHESRVYGQAVTPDPDG